MEKLTSDIISQLRKKFIDNLDEGLLLIDEVASDFNVSSPKLQKAISDCLTLVPSGVLEEVKTDLSIYRKDPLLYLACRQRTSKNDSLNGSTDMHRDMFIRFWNERLTVIKKILQHAAQIISSETISESDKVVINVGYRGYDYDTKSKKLYDIYHVHNNGRIAKYVKEQDCKGKNATFADIFIFSNKYFVKLSFGDAGVIERVEHIIQRDIKNLRVVNNLFLQIHFHGYHDAETIVLDDYNTALELQRHISELRQLRLDKEHKSQLRG